MLPVLLYGAGWDSHLLSNDGLRCSPINRHFLCVHGPGPRALTRVKAHIHVMHPTYGHTSSLRSCSRSFLSNMAEYSNGIISTHRGAYAPHSNTTSGTPPATYGCDGRAMSCQRLMSKQHARSLRVVERDQWHEWLVGSPPVTLTLRSLLQKDVHPASCCRLSLFPVLCHWQAPRLTKPWTSTPVGNTDWTGMRNTFFELIEPPRHRRHQASQPDKVKTPETSKAAT